MVRMSPEEIAYIKKQKVARLTTISKKGIPHAVPVCYAFDGKMFYTGAARESKKGRNLIENKNVCLIIDNYYDDDWSILDGVLIQGNGEFLDEGRANVGRRLLTERYVQYQTYLPLTTNPIIGVKPLNVVSWGLSNEQKKAQKIVKRSVIHPEEVLGEV
ncbi:MAG: pyridoxamine 5'-phosphate oxidase family protein [Candidatus Hodarchaeota archaeon]